MMSIKYTLVWIKDLEIVHIIELPGQIWSHNTIDIPDLNTGNFGRISMTCVQVIVTSKFGCFRITKK